MSPASGLPPPASRLPPIIGFCGRAGAGKSTAALIVGELGSEVYRRSFADPIRQMLHCIGLTAHDLSRGKETPHHLLGDKTPRQAMQTLGTEWGRQMIDSELWLRVARHNALRIIDLGGTVVFDDVRFDNEARLIRSLGGMVIKVVRAGQPQEAPVHASEAGVSDSLIKTTLIAADQAELRTLIHSRFNEYRATA